jgi:hypothetical protein
MPTSANTPDQRSDRYARYIQVGPTPATHLSRWVHPNGTTKSHPPPSIVKALTPSQLADTPSSPLPHNHAHLGRALSPAPFCPSSTTAPSSSRIPMGYLPRSRSLSLTSKSIVQKGASGSGTPSTPVGVEKRPESRSACKHRCNTALTQSRRRWASTAHMRGLGAMRRFPGLPSIA